MSDYAELLERVKAATGPDREVDAEIAMAAGVHSRSRDGGRSKGWLIEANGGTNIWANHPPAYTESMDAIVALIQQELPGWRICSDGPMNSDGHYSAFIERSGDLASSSADGLRTRCLALCAAFLAAKIAQAAA